MNILPYFVVLPKRLLLLNYNINAQLYILNQRNFTYCAVSSQLSYFTLNIIDFAGATFLINKRVWLKTCLLEFIIHLVTVLCMYSFTCLCTHLFVACLHVNSFLLQKAQLDEVLCGLRGTSIKIWFQDFH